METTTMSSKGQVVIPKSVRTDYAWESGVEFQIERIDGAIVLRPKNPFPPTTLDDIVGFLQNDGPTVTLEDMEAAIEKGILEEWGDRSRHKRAGTPAVE